MFKLFKSSDRSFAVAKTLCFLRTNAWSVDTRWPPALPSSWEFLLLLTSFVHLGPPYLPKKFPLVLLRYSLDNLKSRICFCMFSYLSSEFELYTSISFNRMAGMFGEVWLASRPTIGLALL